MNLMIFIESYGFKIYLKVVDLCIHQEIIKM